MVPLQQPQNRYPSSVSWSLYNNHRTDTPHLCHGPSTTTTEQILLICVMVPLQQPQNRYSSSVSWSLYNNHRTDTPHLHHGPSTTTTEQILLICVMVPLQQPQNRYSSSVSWSLYNNHITDTPSSVSWSLYNNHITDTYSSASWSLYNNHRTDTPHLCHGPSTTTTEQIPLICVMVRLQQLHNIYPSSTTDTEGGFLNMSIRDVSEQDAVTFDYFKLNKMCFYGLNLNKMQ